VKLAQAQIKNAAINIPHVTIPPLIHPQTSRVAPIQAFDVWNRLNEKRYRDLGGLVNLHYKKFFYLENCLLIT